MFFFQTKCGAFILVYLSLSLCGISLAVCSRWLISTGWWLAILQPWTFVEQTSIHFMPHHIYKIQSKVCIHLLFFSIFFIFVSICVFEYLSISPYRYAAPPPQLAAIKGGRKSGFRTALHFSVDTKFHALR